jgi:hypothetical protein
MLILLLEVMAVWIYYDGINVLCKVPHAGDRRGIFGLIQWGIAGLTVKNG